MIFRCEGDCIECRKAVGKTRKFSSAPPEHHPLTGHILFSYVLSGTAEICVKLPLADEDQPIYETSHREKGDELRGYRIDMLTAKPVKKKRDSVRMGSSAHRARFFNTRKHTCAEIATALSSHT